MPPSLVKSLADKANKSVKRAEELWKKAKELAKEAGKAENYAYIVGILKKSLGLSKTAMQEFVESNKVIFTESEYRSIMNELKEETKMTVERYKPIEKINEKELTTAEREALPDSAFVFPSERKYPIHDKVHAQNALARVAQYGTPEEQKKVKAAVNKKYPDMIQEESTKRYKPIERELKENSGYNMNAYDKLQAQFDKAFKGSTIAIVFFKEWDPFHASFHLKFLKYATDKFSTYNPEIIGKKYQRSVTSKTQDMVKQIVEDQGFYINHWFKKDDYEVIDLEMNSKEVAKIIAMQNKK